MRPRMEVEIAGLKLKNPVMPASGTFGFGQEYSNFFDLNRLGAIVVKSVTLEPTMGNSPPRIVETPSGMLNAIGLQNPGLQVFVDDKMPFLRQLQLPVIVNIAGKTLEEYAELAGRLDEVEGVAALEVNISCPNVKAGGIAFGTHPDTARRVTETVRRATRLPLIIKLSPNVTDIVEMAKAVEAGGADAISLVNSLTGMVIDIHHRRPVLGNITGGLTGPAIRPVALLMVWRVAQAVQVPVIGMGGIVSASDAVQFLLAGAKAVAVGTATFRDPTALVQVIEGIESYLMENNIEDINDIIGAAQDSR
ncbi:MAG: dihydroorotate dehydrogenase [Bacillota bacterium]